MKRVSVSVQNDYLERMSKTRPINAVAELVWNSLDADADKIKVKLFENEMGGLEKLTVSEQESGIRRVGADEFALGISCIVELL
jgi:hypothetical protein